jgi:probable phosphoglycerate mutase
MKVYCLRHGNTFGPDQQGGERIYYCGSKNNIPLVKTGREQIRSFASYLTQQGINLKTAYASSLIRVWESGVIIREHFLKEGKNEFPIFLDDRLMELDYGDWGGVNEEKIIEKFGEESVRNWQEKRIAPSNANWQLKPENVKDNLASLFDDLIKQYKKDDEILIISSQGVLTFLPHLMPGGMEEAIANDRYKVKTGRFCLLDYDYDNKVWKLIKWNERAE